jgi:hypothetical protein
MTWLTLGYTDTTANAFNSFIRLRLETEFSSLASVIMSSSEWTWQKHKLFGPFMENSWNSQLNFGTLLLSDIFSEETNRVGYLGREVSNTVVIDTRTATARLLASVHRASSLSSASYCYVTGKVRRSQLSPRSYQFRYNSSDWLLTASSAREYYPLNYET